MTVTLLFGELTLKNIICRLRPCNVFTDFPMLIARPTSYSFPSGHTSSSFAAALILTLRHKKVGWLAYIPAVLIAFSRIFFLSTTLPMSSPASSSAPSPPSSPTLPPRRFKTTGREAHGTNLNRLFRQIKAARRFHSLRAFPISVQFFLVSSFLSILPTLSVHYARRLPESQ